MRDHDAHPTAANAIAWGLIAVLVGVLSFANWLTDPGGPPPGPLGAVLVVVVVAIATAVLGARADRVIGAAKRWLLVPSPRTFALVAAGLGFSGAAFFAWYCLDGQMWIIDEMTQRFQANTLLRGRVSLVAEPMHEFFETRQTAVVDDRWFSEFPVGGATLVAVAEALRAAWLLNAVMTAVSCWALYRLLRRAGGEPMARLATLLFASSPFVLFLGASRMDHPRVMAAMLVALVALARWATATDAAGRRIGAVGVGFGLGVLAAIRPYDAVLAAIPIALFQARVAWREPERRTALIWQFGAGALLVAVTLGVNAATTGHALQFGYDVINGPAHRPGFHRDPEGAEFTIGRGLLQTSYYFARLNTVLLEWPVPVLALVVLTLALDRGRSVWETLLVAIGGAMALGYAAYWHAGDGFGPRFLFLAVPGLIVCVTRFPAALARRVAAPFARRFAWLLVGACAVAAWLPVAPEARSNGVWVRASLYRAALHPPFPFADREVAKSGITNALVFVREPWNERLAGRLRALGLSPFGTDRVLIDFDACALQEALDAEDAIPASPADDRLQRLVRYARQAGSAEPIDGAPGAAAHLVFVRDRPFSERCREELAADARGTVTYAHFLAYNTIDADGRIGGPVVYVRDLGELNEALRDRFPGRQWYRYQSVPGEPTFAPY
jgi:hypothetical protein